MVSKVNWNSSTEKHGPDYVCSMCGQPMSTCRCAGGNTEIADKIGFLFSVEDGQWYNRSYQLATEEDAGFCAYHHGVKYGDLTSAAMRNGWLQASGFEDYCTAMMREGVTPVTVVANTAIAAGQAYRIEVHA